MLKPTYYVDVIIVNINEGQKNRTPRKMKYAIGGSRASERFFNQAIFLHRPSLYKQQAPIAII
jgi:hypothetical protein